MTVATTPYFNCTGCGGRRDRPRYVFYAAVPLGPDRTVAGVELPGPRPGGGALHVFALAMR